ncbi:MAG: polysaccharide deacetylase family protein [Acidimicrobiales bacterium]
MGERGPCPGCREVERLGRRRFLQLLAGGAALALAGCTSQVRALASHRKPKETVPTAAPATVVGDGQGGPPIELGQIPPPHPGEATLVWSGPAPTQTIAWTVDDGYCQQCIAGYVAFAQSSGIHLTLNPNGMFNELWTPSVVAQVREMVANKQVQFGNHTWSHKDLTKLPAAAIKRELSRNEAWIEDTFGVTARPYFRPPYGFYNTPVLEAAGALGYTSILMWNGTFGDATLETPEQIIGLAEKWLKPGTIMLGHLNHAPILELFDQIQSIIASRSLDPVTLDEMFGTSRLVG